MKPDNIILSFPLEEGKIWGSDDSFPRDDSMYCWVLEEVGNKKLKIKGLKSKKLVKVFLISYGTLPDHIFIEYAEGIGIIRYEYGHHGTVSECNMKLAEFIKGK